MGTGGVPPPPNSEAELPHCEGQTFLTWKMGCVCLCVCVCLCLCARVCTVGTQLLTDSVATRFPPGRHPSWSPLCWTSTCPVGTLPHGLCQTRADGCFGPKREDTSQVSEVALLQAGGLSRETVPHRPPSALPPFQPSALPSDSPYVPHSPTSGLPL